MAPHAPENEGWTVVTRVRSKSAEKEGKKVLPLESSKTIRNPLNHKKKVEKSNDVEAPLVGWGGFADFYGPCRYPVKETRGSEKKPKDEVAVLVKKVEQARLAVEASEFYRQFLEEWRAKALSKSLLRATSKVEQEAFKAEKASTLHSRADSRCTATELSDQSSLKKAAEGGQMLDISEITNGGHCQASKNGATSQRTGDSRPVAGASGVDLLLEEEQEQPDVVVYGVGSISGSETSRCQLAFALLLKDLSQQRGQLLVYDPALTELDQQAIQRLGCKIIATNEEGRRTVDRPTLFYMPHCEEWLYDNVLLANWQAERLSQIAILGNSFSDYHDRFGSCSASRQAKMWHIEHVVSVLEEVRLGDHGFSNASAFNDMSWHTFRAVLKDGLLVQT